MGVYAVDPELRARRGSTDQGHEGAVSPYGGHYVAAVPVVRGGAGVSDVEGDGAAEARREGLVVVPTRVVDTERVLDSAVGVQRLQSKGALSWHTLTPG